MKQLQLFRTVSYDPKKRIYWFDLGKERFASIHVDENDIVQKTRGFGYRTWLHGRYLGIAKGRDMVKDYMDQAERAYALRTGRSMKDGSCVKPEPMRAHSVNFTVKTDHCSNPEKAINNYKRLGFNVQVSTDGRAFSCALTF